MKIAHLTKHFGVGGAGKAIKNLHNSLRILDHDSRVYFEQGCEPDAHAQEIRVRRSIYQRLRSRFAFPYSLELSRDALATAGTAVFSDHVNSKLNYSELLAFSPDIYSLNWVAQFLDLATFFRITKSSPIAWRITDLNPLTGGCHSTIGCQKFTDGCIVCPQLSNHRLRHRVASNWRDKKRVFDRLNKDRLTLIAQSEWMSSKLEMHPFLSRFPRTIIRNGVDKELFHCRNKVDSRGQLGIPVNAKAGLLFAKRGDRRRASDQYWDAIRNQLDSQHRLIIIGSLPVDLVSHPFVHQFSEIDQCRLPVFYNASDYLVFPHREDNCPNTVLESQACGKPVIAFRNSGISELVTDRVNGILVSDGDFTGLSQASVLLDPEQFSSGEVAETVAGLRKTAASYIDVYRQAVERMKTSKKSPR